MECQHGVVGCVPGTEMLIVFASDLWFSLVLDYLHKNECMVFLFCFSNIEMVVMYGTEFVLRSWKLYLVMKLLTLRCWLCLVFDCEHYELLI